MKIHFNTLWVTKGEMCVLEGSRLFKMCLHIKDSFFAESCACLSFRYFGREFNSRVM